MSGRIVGEVLRYAPDDLRPAEYMVLIVIAEDARDTNRATKPLAVTEISDRARFATGTVRNALMRLVKNGIVHPLRNDVGRGRKPQEYRVAKLEQHHRFTTLADVVPLHRRPE